MLYAAPCPTKARPDLNLDARVRYCDSRNGYEPVLTYGGALTIPTRLKCGTKTVARLTPLCGRSSLSNRKGIL